MKVSRYSLLLIFFQSVFAFELMLEVRNKLLDSYQEIMRMQV